MNLPRNVECNLTIGDKFVFIKPNGDGECSVNMAGQGFNTEELAMVNVIARTIHCFMLSVPINHYFNPVTDLSREGELVKLEWLRSGKLLLRDKHASKKYQHASTIDEAMVRRRVFTCPRYLYMRLPPCRPKRKDSCAQSKTT